MTSNSKEPSAGRLTPESAAILTAGLMIAQFVGAKATRDTLFLSAFPASQIPTVTIAAAVLSIGAALWITRWIRKKGPTRTAPLLFLITAAFFLAEWFLASRSPKLTGAIVYLHVAGLSSIPVSCFWSAVNETFDPHSAKKIVGRITAGAALGGLAGGVLIERLGRSLGVSQTLLLLSGLSVCAAFVVHSLGSLPAAAGSGSKTPDQAKTSAMRQPYLRNIALLVLLSALVSAVADFLVKAEASTHLNSEQKLISFFAYFYTGGSVLVFIVQALLTRRLLEWKQAGLAGTLAALPSLLAIGGSLSMFAPHFYAIALLGLLESVLSSSLFRSGYELLYTPIQPETKREAKTVIDVGADRVGKIFASGLILVALSLVAKNAHTILLAVIVASSLLALLLCLRLRVGYIEELASSLRAGVVRLTAQDIIDATTRRTVADTQIAIDRSQLLAEIQKLRGADAETRPDIARSEGSKPTPTIPAKAELQALLSANSSELRQLLSKHRDNTSLTALVIPLTNVPDVSQSAMRFLRRVAPRISGHLTDFLLDSSQPTGLRRRMAWTLASCPSSRSALGLTEAMRDTCFEIRYHATRSLFQIVALKPHLAPRLETVMDQAYMETQVPSEVWRTRQVEENEPYRPSKTAPPELASRSLQHVLTILSLRLEPEPLELSFRALEGTDPMLRGTAREYLENVLPNRVYEALSRQIGAHHAPPSPRKRESQQLINELLKSKQSPKLD